MYDVQQSVHGEDTPIGVNSSKVIFGQKENHGLLDILFWNCSSKIEPVQIYS